MSQETRNLASGSSSGSYNLESIYQGALDRLQSMQDAGQLSSTDYALITSTSTPGEALLQVEAAKASSSKTHPNVIRLMASVKPLLSQLERFGGAIDMVVQSSPQIVGFSILGLVWGSIKFMVTVSPSTAYCHCTLLKLRRIACRLLRISPTCWALSLKSWMSFETVCRPWKST